MRAFVRARLWILGLLLAAAPLVATSIVARPLVATPFPPATGGQATQVAADPPVTDEIAAMAPTKSQERISGKILYELQTGHLQSQKINDSLSERLLDHYLEFLDPGHWYFLASDAASFQKYRDTLDDSMTKGDLQPAFEIFSRWVERRLDRYEFLASQLAAGIDGLTFDKNLSFDSDREKASWFASQQDSDELWHERFLNDVLSLRLAGREPKDIKEVLQRRYDNQIRFIKQTNGDDAFRVYMNVIAGLYDPHTEYFPPRNAENFDIEMSLSLEGIGALLEPYGEYTRIVNLIPGGPAEKGGVLKAADRIVAVAQDKDGEWTNVIGWRLDDVVDLIRGPKGSTVRLEVLPADQPESGTTTIVSIVRDRVKLEEQEAKSERIDVERDGRTYHIGLVRLPAFYIDFDAARRGDKNFKSSSLDVMNLLVDLEKEGVDGIILDLRNNGGGSLYEAKQVSGLFLSPRPVVQVRDVNGDVDVQSCLRREALTGPNGRNAPVWEGPLVVMTNRLSASASEILAGAIQDYGRGILVGTRTFGKGTVQNLSPLEDGQLKLTQAKFYRVSGESTQERGVTPDVEFPSEYDLDEIGESSLPDPLPWDHIDPAPYYRKDGAIDRMLTLLRYDHQRRSDSDPEFQYVKDLIEYRHELEKDTVISLDEKVRVQQREEDETRRLGIENKRRAALGEKPITSFEELTDASDAAVAAGGSTDDPEGADDTGTAAPPEDHGQSPKGATGPTAAPAGDGPAGDGAHPATGEAKSDEKKPDAFAREAAEILVDSIRILDGQRTVRR